MSTSIPIPTVGNSNLQHENSSNFQELPTFTTVTTPSVTTNNPKTRLSNCLKNGTTKCEKCIAFLIIVMFVKMVIYGVYFSMWRNTSTPATTTPPTAPTTYQYQQTYEPLPQYPTSLKELACNASLLELETNFSIPSLSSSCDTTACKKMVRDLKTSIDTRYDPCKYFFHYACGQWNNTYKAERLNKSSEQVYDDVENRNLDIIRDILEDLQPSSDANINDTAVQKAKQFYMSCITRVDNSDVGEGKHYNSSGLSTFAYQAFFNFSTHFGGADPNPIFCSGLTRHLFPEVVARLFVEKSFTGKDPYLADMYSALKSTYKLKINCAPWIDKASTDYLIGRFDTLKIMLGYPAEIMDIAAVNKKYSNVTVSQDGHSFFDNFEALYPLTKTTIKTTTNVNSSDDDIEHIELRLNILDTTTSNAFYSGTVDRLIIPAGIAMDPLFDKDYPLLFNFAGLGSTIGHEMSHALEYYFYGLHWKYGPNKTELEFRKRLTCIQNQYNGFWVDNGTLQVNGTSTLRENFADIAGLQVAYEAYFRTHTYSGAYDTIPGLEGMSPNKLFFIGYAQKWCRHFDNNMAKDDVLRKQIQTDNHSPNIARVLGQMSNFPEFAKTFDCKLGSAYNPYEQCHIFE